MNIVQGLTMQGETISVDGKQFIDCTFIDCVIEYTGEPVILERTAMLSCRYRFSGPARMTLQFLDCVGLLPGGVISAGAQINLVN